MKIRGVTTFAFVVAVVLALGLSGCERANDGIIDLGNVREVLGC